MAVEIEGLSKVRSKLKYNQSLYVFYDGVPGGKPVQVEFDQSGAIKNDECTRNNIKYFYTGKAKEPKDFYYLDPTHGLCQIVYSKVENAYYKQPLKDGASKLEKIIDTNFFTELISGAFLRGRVQIAVRSANIAAERTTPVSTEGAAKPSPPKLLASSKGKHTGLAPNRLPPPVPPKGPPVGTNTNAQNGKKGKSKFKASRKGMSAEMLKKIQALESGKRGDPAPSPAPAKPKPVAKPKKQNTGLKGSSIPKQDAHLFKDGNVKSKRVQIAAQIQSGFAKQMALHGKSPGKPLPKPIAPKPLKAQDKLHLLNEGIQAINQEITKSTGKAPKLSAPIKETFKSTAGSSIHVGSMNDEISASFNGDEMSIATKGDSLEMVQTTVYLYLKAHCEKLDEIVENAAKKSSDRSIEPRLKGDGGLLTFDIDSDDAELVDKFRKECAKYNMKLFKDYQADLGSGLKGKAGASAESDPSKQHAKGAPTIPNNKPRS